MINTAKSRKLEQAVGKTEGGQGLREVERMLYRYGELNAIMDDVRCHIRELCAEKHSCMDDMLIPPVPCTEKRNSKCNDSDMVRDIVCKMADVYETRITTATEYLKKIYSEHDEIRRKIYSSGLTEDERKYVKLRYVEKLSTKEIVRILNYSGRQVERFGQKVRRALGDGLCK